MSIRALMIFGIALLLQGCMGQLYKMQHRVAISSFEQIGFKDIATRYFLKDKSSVGSIEGIYTVSIVINKKGKGFLSSVEKEKTVERRENYCKVAIFRDPGSSTREYFEVTMDKETQPTLSVVGEFTKTAEGPLFIYKHIEAGAKTSSYTFTYDEASNLLEGIRTENTGSAVFTYKLTYLKLLPKTTLRAER